VVLAAAVQLLSPLVLASPAPPSIELASIATHQVITPQLQVLRDARASELLSTALASGPWEAIHIPMLQEGYSTGAFWLRGQVRNDSSEHVTRWLAMGSARLQDVRLYWLPSLPSSSAHTADEVIPRYAGTLHPIARREIASRTPLFPLTLAPGEERQWVLRVAGDSAIDLNVALWESAAFRQDEGRELSIQAFVLGVSVLLVTYALIQGIAWHDRGFVLMAAWIVTALAYIWTFQGICSCICFRKAAPGWCAHRPPWAAWPHCCTCA
jgi:hypothetical protein